MECAGCGVTVYCSLQCQADHIEHGDHCRDIRENMEDYIHLRAGGHKYSLETVPRLDRLVNNLLSFFLRYFPSIQNLLNKREI